jgi:hypothetical protein
MRVQMRLIEFVSTDRFPQTGVSAIGDLKGTAEIFLQICPICHHVLRLLFSDLTSVDECCILKRLVDQKIRLKKFTTKIGTQKLRGDV